MTFGSVINLYKAIKDRRMKIEIANHYGIRYIEILENYLEIVRELRNFCAHGNVLYDFVPFKYIRKGPAEITKTEDFRNLNGSISVVLYLLRQISVNRHDELIEYIRALINHYSKSVKVAGIISNISGIDASDIK